MTNPAKSKGTKWERRVADYLVSVFPDIDRRAQAGKEDKGDFINTGPWCIEAKNHRRLDLSGWVDQAVKEAKNAAVPYPVVVFPRRSHSIEKCYALMPMWTLRELMAELAWLHEARKEGSL